MDGGFFFMHLERRSGDDSAFSVLSIGRIGWPRLFLCLDRTRSSLISKSTKKRGGPRLEQGEAGKEEGKWG